MLRSKVALILLALYLMVLLSLTMMPAPRIPAESVNLIPFSSIVAGVRRGGWLLTVNIFGNVVAFTPLGMLLPLWNARLSAARQIFVISLITSTAIEVLQWGFMQRVADIDDIVLNVLGALVGYCCYTLLTE